jgi:plastocyanin
MRWISSFAPRPAIRAAIDGAKLVLLSFAASACDNQPRAATAPAAAPNEVVGKAAPAVRGLPSAILLIPDANSDLPAAAEPAIMDQFAIAFSPRLLLVQRGQPVEFRNSEEVPHNVRVRSLATDSVLFSESPEMGRPFVYSFDRTGEYRVSCDIHSGMTAFILVIATPYAAVAEDDGSFVLRDVPPGTYTLSVWHIDQALRAERAVEISPGRTELTIDSIR